MQGLYIDYYNSLKFTINSFISRIYAQSNLRGGHVIMLGPNCEKSALAALSTFPSGLQIGGGINDENALMFLDAGASHVIITSFVFYQGEVDFDKLRRISNLIGKKRLVLDLSCRKKSKDETKYFVVTDKWTKFTNFEINKENLCILAEFCDEFLVHAVDVEGKQAGIDKELVSF